MIGALLKTHFKGALKTKAGLNIARDTPSLPQSIRQPAEQGWQRTQLMKNLSPTAMLQSHGANIDSKREATLRDFVMALRHSCRAVLDRESYPS
jgi:hypothetical protein